MLHELDIRDIQLSVLNGTLRRDIAKDKRLFNNILTYVEQKFRPDLPSRSSVDDSVDDSWDYDGDIEYEVEELRERVRRLERKATA